MLPNKIFFDELFDLKTDERNMKCDIYEEEGNYIIEASLPGFNKEDVKIEYNEGKIIISAEKEKDEVSKDKRYIRKETHFSNKYERSFYLGDLDESNINAKFKNGILKITAPKLTKENNKKYIDID